MDSNALRKLIASRVSMAIRWRHLAKREAIMSALPPKADITESDWHVRKSGDGLYALSQKRTFSHL